ncbi:hypothetical protein BH10PAT3_BH10PAT3_8270 [soil metagenome]
MKRRAAAGYTILEVMIVMAVTGAMFLSVSLMLSGKQAETQFTQAVRDYESKIQSVSAEVRNGYYQSGTFNCSATDIAGTKVNISALPVAEAGTNKGCVFLGKVMTMGKTSADIFTVAGRQFIGASNSGDVKDLGQAVPKAVARAGYDVTEQYEYKYGLEVKNVYLIGTPPLTSVGGFGFMIELGGGAGSGNPVTGSRGVLLYRLAGPTAPNTNVRTLNADAIDAAGSLIAAPEGIRICLWDGGNRRAEITVGANASQSETFVTIGSGISTECQNA